MTTHTGLTHEQEPFTMTLTLPAFLDALTSRFIQARGPVTYDDLAYKITSVLEDLAKKHPTPALGWSEWLEWVGGPCPLPPNIRVIASSLHTYRFIAPSDVIGWEHVTGFSYQCLPSGWLLRGDFIPPAALWDEACPVRCEWTCAPQSSVVWRTPRDMWDGGIPVTHIRLLPREKACEMPEGFAIDREGWLTAPDGRAVIAAHNFHLYGPDTIRRAVDAWLASMKERGNG